MIRPVSHFFFFYVCQHDFIVCRLLHLVCLPTLSFLNHSCFSHQIVPTWPEAWSTLTAGIASAVAAEPQTWVAGPRAQQTTWSWSWWNPRDATRGFDGEAHLATPKKWNVCCCAGPLRDHSWWSNKNQEDHGSCYYCCKEVFQRYPTCLWLCCRLLVWIVDVAFAVARRYCYYGLDIINQLRQGRTF